MFFVVFFLSSCAFLFYPGGGGGKKLTPRVVLSNDNLQKTYLEPTNFLESKTYLSMRRLNKKQKGFLKKGQKTVFVKEEPGYPESKLICLNERNEALWQYSSHYPFNSFDSPYFFQSESSTEIFTIVGYLKNKVFVLSETGEKIREIQLEKPGILAAECSKPIVTLFLKEKLIICRDIRNNSVYIYNDDGKLLSSLSLPRYPSDLAVLKTVNYLGNKHLVLFVNMQRSSDSSALFVLDSSFNVIYKEFLPNIIWVASSSLHKDVFYVELNDASTTQAVRYDFKENTNE